MLNIISSVGVMGLEREEEFLFSRNIRKKSCLMNETDILYYQVLGKKKS